MVNKKNVILSEKYYMNEGTARVCYIHPDNPNRCIKIVKNGRTKECEREVRYYQRLISRKVDMSYLVAFFGRVVTNLGMGYVFELCKDNEDDISQPIKYYFRKNSRIETLIILKELCSVRKYLIKNRVIIQDANCSNIVFNSRTKSIQFVDGIGNYDFFPFANYFDFFAKKKINRRFDKLEKSLFDLYPDNDLIQESYKRFKK